MLSGWYPINSPDNLTLNIFWDGIFHSGTYILVRTGVFLLWLSALLVHRSWLLPLVGSVLMGWGCFNLLEGIVNHTLLPAQTRQ